MIRQIQSLSCFWVSKRKNATAGHHGIGAELEIFKGEGESEIIAIQII